IELSYRITDSLGNLVEAATPVRKENHKTYVVLENVKPEDAEGIKQLNTEPDDAQILTDLELQARDLLVKSVQEKVQRLPGRMLEQARQRAQQQDAEGAAEGYILYLNSTPDIASPERTEAAAYLRDHFNLAVAKNASRP
ncbi:MAG TPA: hypothetical protein VEW69_00095, partial [Alphaproteobacteria bacterium]|nr:hypothetical protein [Alphaproteobacteria bacterium]